MTAAAPAGFSVKNQFLETFEREHATTMRVLRAFPPGKESVQPHPKLKNALNLAWIFTGEMGMLLTAMTSGFDWSNPPKSPPAPATLGEVIATFDQFHAKVVQVVSGMTDTQLMTETVTFPSGPGKMGTPSKLDFLWFVLADQIHHRGQFSVYLRMADGKLPSIYGPTADEPWF